MPAAVKASTHRLDSDVQAALDHLSAVLHEPKNRLINEAVKFYVAHRSRKVEHELESTLTKLRAYRRADPDFDQAIDAFVEAEVANAASDPVEGRRKSAKGPLQTKVQHLIHG